MVNAALKAPTLAAMVIMRISIQLFFKEKKI